MRERGGAAVLGLAAENVLPGCVEERAAGGGAALRGVHDLDADGIHVVNEGEGDRAAVPARREPGAVPGARVRVKEENFFFLSRMQKKRIT